MLQLTVDQSAARASGSSDGAGEFGIWTDYRIAADRSLWHKQVARFYEYWLAVAPEDRLPGRRHIVPEDLASMWPRLWMLDVQRNPLRYRYRFCGGAVVRSVGREVTGCWLDEVHPQLLANPHSRDRFRFIVETGCPTWRRGPPLWTHNPDHRTIESCIVPLAADGRTVDKIFGISVVYDSKGREI